AQALRTDPAVGRPALGCLRTRRLLRVGFADNRDNGSQLFLAGVSARDAQRELTHSGMFPCFLGGNSARLRRRARSALAIMTRVWAGSMTLSISPRSAARKGLATLYVYSSASFVRTAATS